MNSSNYLQVPSQLSDASEIIGADLDVAALGDEIDALRAKFLKEKGRQLSSHDIINWQGLRNDEPSREITMNTDPSTPEASRAIDAVNQAYGEALFAAEPVRADACEALDLNTQDHSYADYDRNAAELTVQAHVIAQQNLPADPDFADLVGKVERDKQTFAVPMSPEQRSYAYLTQAGQTTGATARFGALAQSTTLDRLAEMTRAAEATGNHLEHITLDIRTAREKAAQLPRYSVDLTTYTSYLSKMNQNDFGLGA
mgnify:CR=1 FL=1